MWGPVLELAQRYANDDTRLRRLFPDGGIFFYRDPSRLELWYEPETVAGHISMLKKDGRELRPESEIYDEFTQIVQSAVQQAISEEGQYFAGILVENLRNGNVPWQN